MKSEKVLEEKQEGKWKVSRKAREDVKKAVIDSKVLNLLPEFSRQDPRRSVDRAVDNQSRNLDHHQFHDTFNRGTAGPPPGDKKQALEHYL